MKYKALQLTEEQAGLLAGLLERQLDHPYKPTRRSTREFELIHAKLRLLTDDKW